MKKVVGVLLVLVILGSIATPVVAARTAEDSYTCPSCSGVITIPNDVKSSIVRGSIAYLKAVQVFNSKDSLKLREQLKNLNLKPVYSEAIVQVVSHKGVTTEIVKIPLKGKKSGLLVYVKNNYGEAIGLGVFDESKVTIYLLENGQVKKIESVLKWNWPDKCEICKKVVSKLCDVFGGRACAQVCANICTKLGNPGAMVVCGIVCYAACKFGVHELCEYGADEACDRLGFC